MNARPAIAAGLVLVLAACDSDGHPNSFIPDFCSAYALQAESLRDLRQRRDLRPYELAQLGRAEDYLRANRCL